MEEEPEEGEHVEGAWFIWFEWLIVYLLNLFIEIDDFNFILISNRSNRGKNVNFRETVIK